MEGEGNTSNDTDGPNSTAYCTTCSCRTLNFSFNDSLGSAHRSPKRRGAYCHTGCCASYKWKNPNRTWSDAW